MAAEATIPSAEAGAPEIEVTPEMIEAGIDVLYKSGAVEHQMCDVDRELIQKIFLAMLHARRSSG
jgi:hypothetical protein